MHGPLKVVAPSDGYVRDGLRFNPSTNSIKVGEDVATAVATFIVMDFYSGGGASRIQ